MKIRKSKKKGDPGQAAITRKKKPEHYKKGWNSYQEHHIVPRESNGCDASVNKITLAGKIHYCWHQVFGNLDPREAKLFVYLFLSGAKAKWQAREIKQLEQHIKGKELEKSHRLAQYYGEEKLSSLRDKRIGNESAAATIANKKVSGQFLWGWQELFGDLPLKAIQVYISILFGNNSKKWNLKSVRALKQAIRDDNLQRASSIACLPASFSSFGYVEGGRKSGKKAA